MRFGETITIEAKSDFIKNLLTKKSRRCFVCDGRFADGDLATIVYTKKGARFICEDCFNKEVNVNEKYWSR